MKDEQKCDPIKFAQIPQHNFHVTPCQTFILNVSYLIEK